MGTRIYIKSGSWLSHKKNIELSSINGDENRHPCDIVPSSFDNIEVSSINGDENNAYFLVPFNQS